MRALVTIILFLLSFTTPADAHGEEAIWTFMGGVLGFIVGLIFLIAGKASNKDKRVAVTFLAAGFCVVLVGAFLPMRIFGNWGIGLTTAVSVGVSIWFATLKRQE